MYAMYAQSNSLLEQSHAIYATYTSNLILMSDKDLMLLVAVNLISFINAY